MIRKIISPLANFTTHNKPAIININVEVRGKQFTYQFA